MRKIDAMKRSYILIVEDEPAIRSMTCFALEAAGFSVQEAEDVRTAHLLVKKSIPKLILLDWMLPDLNGIAFTKMLKQDSITRNIPIIMLTAKAEEENLVYALETGVDDYIVKPFSPRELNARINAVLRRGPMTLPDGTLHLGSMRIDTNNERATVNGELVKLGPLGYRLLIFLMSHPDRVFTRNDLLNHVWGTDTYVDERTVDVHIRRLRKTLSKHQLQAYIQTVHGSGYRFSEIAEVA